MKYFILILLAFITSPFYSQSISPSSIYDFTVKDIDGRDVPLDSYRGKVIMIVNVASKCGYTYQYEGLESLYKDYAGNDFVILGFPSNDFLWQEPGTEEEIKNFCSVNFGVTFPMFSKIKVTGRDKEPLYEFLTSDETNKDFSGRITWNFNKFLIDREGNIVDRFDSKTEPQSEEVLNALQKLL
ncbi:glutathione peroxidase [Spirochaeta isovalerica]|uniref:Glutathione peroxidase n=1 Tax=Spirochaeta isovalerica TaxID=150 RepID=A0A841REM8_9SPIO|nr:glutathione peroxidase [Spirochaeta isovalerica]MBB6481841.1 glutathione peroxidase [Spirochaeta isovalerica]